MNNNSVPRLCGGTFFTQLLLSRKPTVSQRQRTQGISDVFHNEDVLFALLRIIHPDAVKPTGNSFETYTTNFKKCDGNIGEDLKFENESVRLTFAKRITEDYPAVLRTAVDFCADYIDIRDVPRNHEKLVKRLMEVIRDDTSIKDDELFRVVENGNTVDKKALLEITEVSLPDFVLSIWTFIVMKRNYNNLGKDTIIAWNAPNTKGRYVGNDGSSIKQDIAVTMPVNKSSEETTTEKNESYADCSEPFFEEPSPTRPHNVTTQVINAPAVFINSGANAIQISNTGILNIDRGGKT